MGLVVLQDKWARKEKPEMRFFDSQKSAGDRKIACPGCS
jgi:hypothetical protein